AEVNRTSTTYTLRVRGDSYDNALKYGMTHAVNHPVKKPGAYQLRAAVRDTVSQRVGAASQFIEAPDLSKGRLALSGILIASEAKEAAAAPAPAPATEPKRNFDPRGHPAVRVFKQGSKVHYALQILNPQISRDTQKPDLETQLQVYRDGRQIFAGKVSPFHPNVTPETKGAVAMGQVTLSPSMQPGEYALQVVVTDKLAGEKNRTAAQWIDFEVVRP
ncbi:MAG: hypothetical protein ACRD8O_18555, partial [Bryobacteraceae bacterium]